MIWITSLKVVLSCKARLWSDYSSEATWVLKERTDGQGISSIDYTLFVERLPVQLCYNLALAQNLSHSAGTKIDKRGSGNPEIPSAVSAF